MKKLTSEEFINKANLIHNNKYCYDKVFYVNKRTKVCIICPEHGEFWMSPGNHIVNKQGCPYCGGTKKLSNEQFIARANQIHNYKYDYSKILYKNNRTKVCIICPEHGEFWQIPSSHLKGYGCPECSNYKKLTTEEFIEKAKSVHGDRYDYSKVEYVNSSTKVCIICPEHGEFWQTPDSHINARQGCPYCNGGVKLTNEVFIKKAKAIHGDKYDYSKVKYVNAHNPITIICPEHGEFTQRPNDHLMGHSCPLCIELYNKSSYEAEIAEYIESLGVDVLRNNRTALQGCELDLFIPSLNVAVEFDGLYWHNEQHKENTYHLKKTEECEAKGIQLIHIFEDEWKYKQDIVKSRLCNLMGKNAERIFARKCEIRDVPYSEASNFLEVNHIQGNCVSKYRYGLYHNDELVSIMTFGSLRKNLGSSSKEDCYELLRFCNKIGTTVVGAASRLFSHFRKSIRFDTLISYADRRWSVGNLYETLGFEMKNISKPSYFYVVNDKRENRFKYRKDILVKEGFDSNKSEHQIMSERGIFRIYDCGCKVYQYKNTT